MQWFAVRKKFCWLGELINVPVHENIPPPVEKLICATDLRRSEIALPFTGSSPIAQATSTVHVPAAVFCADSAGSFRDQGNSSKCPTSSTFIFNPVTRWVVNNSTICVAPSVGGVQSSPFKATLNATLCAASSALPTTRNSPCVRPAGRISLARMPFAPADVIRKWVTCPPVASASQSPTLASTPLGNTEPTRRGAAPRTGGDLIPRVAATPATGACLLRWAACASWAALGEISMRVTGALRERSVTFSSGTPLNLTRPGISAGDTAAATVPTEQMPMMNAATEFKKFVRIRIFITPSSFVIPCF